MCQIEKGHLFDATVAVVARDSSHPLSPPRSVFFSAVVISPLTIELCTGSRDWHASMTGTVPEPSPFLTQSVKWPAGRPSPCKISHLRLRQVAVAKVNGSSLCRNFYVSFFHLLFYGVRYSVSRNLSGKGSIYFLSISNEISSELLG